MKSMATKVAMNDKALSKRNRELENEARPRPVRALFRCQVFAPPGILRCQQESPARPSRAVASRRPRLCPQVAALAKQLSVHKGYKKAAAANKELEKKVSKLEEDLRQAVLHGSDSMLRVVTERKKVLEGEVKFLKEQVRKYSTRCQDRAEKAQRVQELELELSQVSQPFLAMNQSVNTMNSEMGGLVDRLNTQLQSEVAGLAEQMNKAADKVKETDQLNARVREYEQILMEQRALMEQQAKTRAPEVGPKFNQKTVSGSQKRAGSGRSIGRTQTQSSCTPFHGCSPRSEHDPDMPPTLLPPGEDQPGADRPAGRGAGAGTAGAGAAGAGAGAGAAGWRAGTGGRRDRAARARRRARRQHGSQRRAAGRGGRTGAWPCPRRLHGGAAPRLLPVSETFTASLPCV